MAKPAPEEVKQLGDLQFLEMFKEECIRRTKENFYLDLRNRSDYQQMIMMSIIQLLDFIT